MMHPYAVLAALRGRLRALFRRHSVEDRLREDIAVHLDMETEKNMRAGMSAGEARRAALIAFGGVDRVAEAHRDARGTRLVEQLGGDVRMAVRVLARTPGYVAVCVCTLAVAIAVGASLFSGVHGFFFRALPVPDGKDLFAVFTSNSSGSRFGSSSHPDLLDFAQGVAGVAELAGETRYAAGVGSGDVVVMLSGAMVSSDYFTMLRVRPALGQFPRGVNVAEPEIVLGHSAWRRRFGADRSLVGRHVIVNGHPFRVAAIAPPEFTGISREHPGEFWIDVAFSPLVAPHDELSSRTARHFRVVGRPRDGVTLDAVRARLATVAARLYQDDPTSWSEEAERGRRVTVVTERAGFAPEVPRRDLFLMAGGIAALGLGLLALACANLASMQLARAVARRREIATRLALGAGRGRLIGQLLTESAVVAVPGTILGLLLMSVIARLVANYRPPQAPTVAVTLDLQALLFSAGALLLALLVFGLLPALQSVRVDIMTDLKDGVPTGRGGLRISKLRGGLVIVQTALSVMFTASAGLIAFALVRHADNRRVDADRVIVAPLTLLPAAGDSLRVAALMRDIVSELQALPGVEAVSVARLVPNAGSRTHALFVQQDAQGMQTTRELDVNLVSPHYFRVVGLPLSRGRDFDDRDLSGGMRVAIVSRALADRLWPGADPIGKRLRMTANEGSDIEIIGVTGDVVTTSASAGAGLLYLPLQPGADDELIVHARSSGSTRAVADPIARQLRMHADRAVATQVTTMDRYMDRAVLGQRITARASAVLALLQFLLAAAGLAGLVAYATAQRRREIGIRSALGASRISILWLVLLQGARLTAIGAAIGVVLSIVMGRIIAVTLPVSATLEFGALAAALIGFALAAGAAMLLPARRALAIAPGTAVRVD